MGVKIGNKHTDSMNLFITDVQVALPEAQTQYVEVVGRNGLIDLSEANGSIRYKNRTVTINCIHKDTSIANYNEVRNTLASYHGQRKNIILDSEKDYYYNGRISVTVEKSSQVHSTYKITADCEPYAIEVQDRGGKWKWDSFNFVTGVIYQREYCNVQVNGTKGMFIRHNNQMPVTPVFELVSGEISVRYNGTTYSLNKGENTIYEVVIAKDNEIITLVGTGIVTIHYRGGKL